MVVEEKWSSRRLAETAQEISNKATKFQRSSILHGMLIAFIGLSLLSLTHSIFPRNYGVMRGVLCSHHSRSTAQK
jgi:hypothetical protein